MSEIVYKYRLYIHTYITLIYIYIYIIGNSPRRAISLARNDLPSHWTFEFLDPKTASSGLANVAVHEDFES